MWHITRAPVSWGPLVACRREPQEGWARASPSDPSHGGVGSEPHPRARERRRGGALTWGLFRTQLGSHMQFVSCFIPPRLIFLCSM